jgi:MerR family copper efflux transcriptional regulator
MNIGTVATKSGVPAKTIRYYESVGLIPSATRASNGYRTYDELDVQVLRFIQRARNLGFSVDEVANLLALWRDKGRSSARVKALALKHLARVERKIRELDTMRRAIQDLVKRCRGNDRPECPILDELADDDGRV